MALFIQVILVAIVLISILNVMVMAVMNGYAKSAIAAIGTLPGKIRALFFYEGLFLGLFGTASQHAYQHHRHHRGQIFAPDHSLRTPGSHSVESRCVRGAILITAAIVIGVTIVAVVEPAYKASKLEPIEALRHSYLNFAQNNRVFKRLQST